MDGKKAVQSAKAIWAYAYQMVPSQPGHRMRAILAILAQEHADARRETRTWAGRIVHEQQITHILVVSDSPEQDRSVNRKLEEELRGLNAAYSLTVPMAVLDDAATATPPAELES